MIKQLIKRLKKIKRPEITLDPNLDKGKARIKVLSNDKIKKEKKVALMFTWRFC